MHTSNSSRGIAVLGMHRSGTSTLAGTLRSAGVHFGDVLDYEFPSNPKGLQEAPSLLFMHEDLLVKNGGCWHEPPREMRWDRLHKEVRNLFIESRQPQDIWAFKDPRTLLVFDGWLEVLPDLGRAGIFRHPAEVATSIHNRNKFDLGKCFDIWTAYNTQLLELLKDNPFPVVEFVSDAAQMEESFDQLLKDLGFQPPDNIPPFYESGLKHIETPDIAVPSEVAHLYAELKERAI